MPCTVSGSQRTTSVLGLPFPDSTRIVIWLLLSSSAQKPPKTQKTELNLFRKTSPAPFSSCPCPFACSAYCSIVRHVAHGQGYPVPCRAFLFRSRQAAVVSKPHSYRPLATGGGGLNGEARTHGLVLPRHALYQLSYIQIWRSGWDSNPHIVSDYSQFSKLFPYQLGLPLHYYKSGALQLSKRAIMRTFVRYMYLNVVLR